MKTAEIILIILISAAPFSCRESDPDNKNKPANLIVKTTRNNLLKKLDENMHFLGDSLMEGKASLIKQLLDNYQPDTCGIMVYEHAILRNGFEGFKVLGDLNGDKMPDSVFILPPFNYCDEGESYYFTDTTLPRVLTISYCCHPDNMFSIGDIDEDGVDEICIFYSSCVSRFKSLTAYSLKNKSWKEIGQSTFDISFMKPDKERRVRKIGKGEFEMLEIVDKEENRKWLRFSF